MLSKLACKRCSVIGHRLPTASLKDMQCCILRMNTEGLHNLQLQVMNSLPSRDFDWRSPFPCSFAFTVTYVLQTLCKILERKCTSIARFTGLYRTPINAYMCTNRHEQLSEGINEFARLVGLGIWGCSGLLSYLFKACLNASN